MLLIKFILKLIARKSPEPYKVGALYIRGFKWSTGYNTSAAYGKHAEDMALDNFKKKYNLEPGTGTIWCSYSPCSHCKKTLSGRDIKSKFLIPYRGKL
jgi:deoxycytidylate deaminase